MKLLLSQCFGLLLHVRIKLLIHPCIYSTRSLMVIAKHINVQKVQTCKLSLLRFYLRHNTKICIEFCSFQVFYCHWLCSLPHKSLNKSPHWNSMTCRALYTWQNESDRHIFSKLKTKMSLLLSSICM